VQVHDTDTGSPEVQISLLSKKIDELANHLKKHAKDKHSRRGLLGMVAERRAHMKYLEKKDKKRYATVVKKLGL
jgi:small subunit ribosomal protein S15